MWSEGQLLNQDGQTEGSKGVTLQVEALPFNSGEKI